MATIAKEVIPVDIEQEMKGSYLDYAMSVIVARALPDVRDGLKPVQRRILYAMQDLGLGPNSKYRKSAKVAGDTSGNYHPHGEEVIYPAIVRLAQDFNIRYPLIDGQGNFGSIDGDPPAAMRYTEVRMAPPAFDMLTDIDKNTVDFIANYDQTRQEPVVLPAKFPNLLVNGSTGIAVGMATNIPPHNLSEIVDALIMMSDNPDVKIDELMTVLKGPDFPTGARIMGIKGIEAAYKKGRGQITMLAKILAPQIINGGKQAIVITELPYQVNKANLLEQIANLVRDRKMDGISDLRDESDRTGMRIVVELKRDASPGKVIDFLCQHTQLRANFGVIMLALVNGEPRVLNLKEMFHYCIEHRKDVITRRSTFELERAKARAHILEGLRIAVKFLDMVIKIIRQAETVDSARKQLMEKFKLTHEQAQAILDMRLQQLTALEQEKLEQEYKELIKQIAYLEGVLADPRKILFIIKEELLDLKRKRGDFRRTEIMSKTPEEMSPSDYFIDERVVVKLTPDGIITRINIDNFKAANEIEPAAQLFVASIGDIMLLFTNKGKVYTLRAIEVPEFDTSLPELVALEPQEFITACLPIKGLTSEDYLILATKQGLIKRVAGKDFQHIKRTGIVAISLNEGDELKWAALTDGTKEILLTTADGFAIRFKEEELRPTGRTAYGVKAIKLGKGDEVVGMVLVEPDQDIIVISENGYGKRTPINEYSIQSRAGKGVVTFSQTERAGKLVDMKGAKQDDEIIIATQNGFIKLTQVADIPAQGRATQGVRLIILRKDDKVTTSLKIAAG